MLWFKVPWKPRGGNLIFLEGSGKTSQRTVTLENNNSSSQPASLPSIHSSHMYWAPLTILDAEDTTVNKANKSVLQWNLPSGRVWMISPVDPQMGSLRPSNIHLLASFLSHMYFPTETVPWLHLIFVVSIALTMKLLWEKLPETQCFLLTQ